MHYSKN